MKSKVKKLAGTARELTIQMPGEIVGRAMDEILEDIRKTANVPGFRPGKAPIDMVRAKHQEEAFEEAKTRAISLGYQEALEKHEVSPASYPEISDIKLEKSGELSFKAKVDTYPEISLKNYTGIKIKAPKIDVGDKEIEDALERVRGMFAEFPDKEGPLSRGDFAVADVQAFIEGVAISEKRNGMWIEVSEEESLLGMGKDLEGLDKGDSKDVEVTLPENYPDKKHAGRKAVFKVEVKDIKERKLPDVDNDLAAKMGKGTPEELREELKNQLLSKKQENQNVSMKNQILEDLIKRHQFDLPETMVLRQLKVLMERAENELTEKGLSPEAITEHKEKLKDVLIKEARDKVRVYFILDEISSKEDIDVSDEEIDNWLSELAKSYKKPFEEVKKYYEEKDLVDGLYEQLKEGKTLDFLLERASIITD